MYRALAGRRLTRGMLRESAREDLPGFARDDYLDEDAFWAQVESARERAAENAQRIKAGDVRHDPKGDGVPGLVRSVADLPGAARVTIVETTTGSTTSSWRPSRPTGSVFVSAGAGTGKTSVLVERYVRAVVRARHRRRVDPRHHVHAQGGRRAAESHPRRAARARATRPRARARRSVDLDDPRLLQPAPARASVRRGPRPAVPRARGRGRCGPARRGVRACAPGVLRRRRPRAAAAARDLPRRPGCGACSPASTRRFAPPGASSSSSSGSARASRARWPRSVSRRSALAADASATATQRRNAGEASCASRRKDRPRSASSISRPSRAGARAPRRSSRRARRPSGRRSRSWRPRSRSPPGAPRALRRRVRGRQAPRVGRRLRGSPARGARPASRRRRSPRRRRGFASGWSWSTSSRTRTDSRCELIDLVAHPELTEIFTVGDEFQSIYGFRHADLEVFRERRAQAPSLLALTQNYRSRPAGARGREPPLRRRVRRRVSSRSPRRPSSRTRSSAIRSSCSSPTSRASRTAPSTGARERRGASRAACASSSTPARPSRARSSSSSPPARTPSATRRRCARRGLPTYRATGRGYFGQQQVVDLLAYLRLLHNRYDDVALATVLASPFVGVSNDALVLLRRNAIRRPLFTALERTLPEGLATSDERLLRAFLQRYERLVRASARIGLEALVRAGRERARLRPRRARALGRDASVREPPQARASGSRLRGDPWCGHRRLRPLRPRAGRARSERARGRRRGGGRRRGPPADDPRGEGARVQGRDRRGRGT